MDLMLRRRHAVASDQHEDFIVVLTLSLSKGEDKS